MADKVWDKCPKCSSKITNRVECATCGIIFEKYFQAQARKKALAEQEPVPVPASGKLTIYIVAGLILLVISSTVFYFLGQKKSPATIRPAVALKVASAPAQAAPPVRSVAKVEFGRSGQAQSDKRFILVARNATVLVKTPWGLGSGFFIASNTVVTNKHVVTFSRAKYEKLKKKVERNGKLLDLEGKYINRLKQRLQQMPAGPDREELAIIIQTRQENLEKYLPKQQKDERMLQELGDNLNSENVTIVMADGSEHSVANIVTSETHDLALLQVYSVSAPILKPERGKPVQGETVYTVGNPWGLKDTVTSGVFSGYRVDTKTNEEYIQTDAAINPGNSGGPLIDSHGRVLGVNTMILKNAEGIGFAIPISTVYSEFNSYL